jgi:hypothetical protein
VKQWLKDNAPGVRRLWRRASRLRWMAKYRVLRYYDAPVATRTGLRYVLWDPEVESHSYELANEGEVAGFCAAAFDMPLEDAERYVEEARREPEFTTELRRRTRWAFDVKTQPPIALRLLWWVLVRHRKPRLVVETGIYEGLGTLVVLVALERNAAEGGPDGRLLSIDSDPASGRLVPEHLKRRWEKAVGYTSDVMDEAVGDRQVDVLIHDTPHLPEIQDHEFGVALAHAADTLTIIEGSGGQLPNLTELARRHGTTVHHFTPEPRDHAVRPHGVDFATFRRTRGGAPSANTD